MGMGMWMGMGMSCAMAVRGTNERPSSCTKKRQRRFFFNSFLLPLSDTSSSTKSTYPPTPTHIRHHHHTPAPPNWALPRPLAPPGSFASLPVTLADLAESAASEQVLGPWTFKPPPSPTGDPLILALGPYHLSCLPRHQRSSRSRLIKHLNDGWRILIGSFGFTSSVWNLFLFAPLPRSSFLGPVPSFWFSRLAAIPVSYSTSPNVLT